MCSWPRCLLLFHPHFMQRLAIQWQSCVPHRKILVFVEFLVVIEDVELRGLSWWIVSVHYTVVRRGSSLMTRLAITAGTVRNAATRNMVPEASAYTGEALVPLTSATE